MGKFSPHFTDHTSGPHGRMDPCAPCSPARHPMRARRRRRAGRAERPGVAARGEVGRHAGAARRPRRPGADHRAQRVQRHRRLPRARRRSATCCPDALLDGEVVAMVDGRPSFRALAERMHVQDRRRAERLAATRPVVLMVFDILRLYGVEPARPAARGAPGHPGAAGAARPALAGATGVRRRAGARGRHPGAGPGGRGEQAAHVDLPARAAQPGLGQAGPPAGAVLPGRRLAARDRQPDRGSARCCSACPRR